MQVRKERRHSLVDVEYKVEHGGCNAKAYKMQKLVIQRQRPREVCESEESEAEHDNNGEENEPL